MLVEGEGNSQILLDSESSWVVEGCLLPPTLAGVGWRGPGTDFVKNE